MIALLLLMGGAASIVSAVALAFDDGEGPVPDHKPDAPAAAGSTRYKLIDKILDKLRASALASGIPLGLMVGWIAKESGGRLSEVTKLDERGLYQLMPEESHSLGLDHERLSTDLDYSIASGPLLIGRYMRATDALGVAPRGSSYYWRLVKLGHTVGSGDVKKLVEGAKAVGEAGSWDAFKTYALDSPNPKPKHSPKKWFPLVDKVYEVGRPFGFGDEGGQHIVGYDDIPDPLECLR